MDFPYFLQRALRAVRCCPTFLSMKTKPSITYQWYILSSQRVKRNRKRSHDNYAHECKRQQVSGQKPCAFKQRLLIRLARIIISRAEDFSFYFGVVLERENGITLQSLTRFNRSGRNSYCVIAHGLSGRSITKHHHPTARTREQHRVLHGKKQAKGNRTQYTT